MSALTVIVFVVRLEHLENALKKDSRLIPAILGFVQYPYNQDIQVEAIKLTQHLVVRLPNLLDFLQIKTRGRAIYTLSLSQLCELSKIAYGKFT